MKPLNPSKDQSLDEVLERFIYHISDWFNPAEQQSLDEIQNQVPEQEKNIVEHNQRSIIIVCNDERVGSIQKLKWFIPILICVIYI